MVVADEDALICDFAETYGVLDYRALPVMRAAVLACGLSADSRIKMAISGAKAPTNIVLMAAAIDRLSTLVWMQTKDGAKGINRPRSILDTMYAERDTAGYAAGADFDTARAALVRRCTDGN